VTNNTNTPCESSSSFSLEANPQPLQLTNVFSDLYFYKLFIKYTDLFSLSNTCSLLYKSKKYLNYKLNREYSLKYYKNKTFRTMVLEKIFNPQKQLYLDLSEYVDDIRYVGHLGNVYSLNLSGCYYITDVSKLGNVHILDLSFCHEIIDVSALANVYFLNLGYCINITDVSKLGNVHTLYLEQCVF